MITKTQPNQSRPWKNTLLTLSVACSLTLPLKAVPTTVLPSTASTNLTVINGTATNSTAGTVLTITATDKTVLSWTNFWDNTTGGGTSAAGDVINYVLPSASSAVLNQVTGGQATQINGSITSNGKVFIANTAGVSIGATGVINAASFGASTISEPLSYFEANGTLAAFGNGLTGATTDISVTNGASITTIGGGGNVMLAGKNVTLGASVTGNALLYGQGGTVTVGTTTGGVTITSTPTSSGSTGGNLTVVNQAGGTTVLSGTAATSGVTTVQGNLSVSTNGGALQVTSSTGGATGSLNVLGNAVIDTSGTTTNGSVTQGTGLFSVSNTGTTTLINTATESTPGNPSTGNPNTTGASAVNPGTITLGNSDFASLSVIGGATSITDAGNLNLGTANVKGTYAATSTTGNIVSTGAITATGNISLTTAAANKGITYTGTGNLKFGTLSVNGTGGFVSITTTGNVSLPAATIPTLTVVTSGGNITETGSIATTTAATFSASGAIALDTSANNLVGTVKLVGGSTGIELANNGAITIATGTATTGNTTISNNGTITFGATAGDTIAFGGNLAIDQTFNGAGAGSGTIDTLANNLTVAGSVGIDARSSNVTLGLAGNTTASFGQIAIANGAVVTINESSTTNLGGSVLFVPSSTAALSTVTGYSGTTGVSGLTASGTLNVVSGGNIVNTSGALTVGGATNVTAGTTSAPGTIQLGLNSTGNIASLGGNVREFQGSSLTVVNSQATNVRTLGTQTDYGTLNVTVTGAGALNVGNGSAGTGSFDKLTFNTNGGAVTFGNDANNLVITNSSTITAGGAVNVTTTGTLTLGSGVTLMNTAANAFQANGISDSAGSSFYIAGATMFTSEAGINLANGTANNVGAVTLVLDGTGAANSIAYAEGSTVNLAGITINTAADAGLISISSATGDIIQTGALALGSNTSLTGVSFSAPTGSVILNNLANVIGTTTATAAVPVSISAKKVSTFDNAANILLGNVSVTAAGLTLDATAAAGSTITQAAGTSVYVYGNPTLNTKNGAITLTNVGNNFGAITANTVNGGTGAAVSITEAATTNYASLTTGSGAWTAKSTSGDIIETSNAALQVGGATSLTAANVTLNDIPSAVFPVTTGSNTFGTSILVKATGNVSLADAATVTNLADGLTVGGNFSITNTATSGTIKDSGSSATLAVTGNAVFSTSSTGNLNLAGTNNTFGAVGFNLGNGASVFTENATTNLLTGTLVAGPMIINSGGNIITSGSGSLSFGSTLRLNAIGSIVLSNPVNVNGQLTVDAVAGPTNLSVDSKAGNLNGITPINLGNASNYTGPNP